MLLYSIFLLLSIYLGAEARRSRVQHIIRPAVDDEYKCPTGVHIVGVRGTLEDPGHGALQAVVDNLKQQIPNSDDTAIEYPATGITLGAKEKPEFHFFDYVASEAQGYAALKTHLEDFTFECPESKVVLMGYSQGAHVVGDVLCGAHGLLFPPKYSIDPYYKENIRAIIQLGDPTNVKGIDWHVGNSTHNGIFPRVSYSACKDLEPQWQSYCDNPDLFCDGGAGGGSIPIHLTYVERYLDDIVKFVVGKVKGSRYTASKNCMNEDL